MARRRSRQRLGILRKVWDWIVMLLGLAALALFIVWLEGGTPQQLHGSIRVVDGDSLEIGGEQVRLQGIDAPEFNQTCRRNGKSWDCGRQSRLALRKLVRTGRVSCEAGTVDKYDRWLATCKWGDKNLNQILVENGWAVDYGGYSKAERSAKAQRKGIWSGEFERPRSWREAQRGDVSGGAETATWFQHTRARFRTMIGRIF